MQEDGNFVVYNNPDHQSNHAIWATGTNGKGHGPYHLKMQADGNLCLYDNHAKCHWASDTYHKGSAPYKLTVQGNGELAIIDSHHQSIWTSKK